MLLGSSSPAPAVDIIRDSDPVPAPAPAPAPASAAAAGEGGGGLSIFEFEFSQLEPSYNSNGTARTGHNHSSSDGNLLGRWELQGRNIITSKKNPSFDQLEYFSIAPSEDRISDLFNSNHHVRYESHHDLHGKQQVYLLERTVTIGECIEEAEDQGAGKKKLMGLIFQEEYYGDKRFNNNNNNNNKKVDGEGAEPVSPPMYVAAGLGIHGSSGRFEDHIISNISLPNFDQTTSTGNINDAQHFYKRMVDKYPCHPLFLRNYAQLLHSKGDFDGAEEYYTRAMLVDPDNPHILSHYAKLVWEFQQDRKKALSYFERAVQSAPHDSHVLAEYASFLWEVQGEEEEDHPNSENADDDEFVKAPNENYCREISPSSHLVEGQGSCDDTAQLSEDCYMKMIKENPTNPSFLKNYTQFLINSKGDLLKAEEYCSRAILADPEDVGIMLQYAKLMWQLHHDQEIASFYFERAVQAAPQDSHVVAAYACFLWEVDELGEDDNLSQSFVENTLIQKKSTTAVSA